MRRLVILGILLVVVLGAWGAFALAPQLLVRPELPESTRARLAVARARLWALRAGVDVRRNIAYRDDAHEARLDLYLPRRSPRPAPVVLYFHGGGWTEGSKDLASLAAVEWGRRGFAVANVGYRLAPSAVAPAAVEDARCAAAWVARHARELHLDSTRMIAAGASAGGHLALMTGLPTGEAGFDRCGPPPTIAAVVNLYGPTDLARLQQTDAHGFVNAWLGPRRDSAEFVRRLSPINWVRRGGPAVWTVHGAIDKLVPVDQANRLHEALGAAGERHRLRVLPLRGHGFPPEETARLLDTLAAEARALLPPATPVWQHR